MSHLYILILLGILLKNFTRAPEHFHRSLNHFILYLSLPATVLLRLPNLWSAFARTGKISLIFLQPWLWYGLVFLCAFAAFRKGWLNRSQAGALMLVVGLGNTSFVGLPVLNTFLGEQSLALGLLLDQLGSFLILSTTALPVALWWKSQNSSFNRNMLLKVVLFPPFLSLMLSLALFIIGLELPQMATTFLQLLASTLMPLALISVGYQLIFSSLLNRQTEDQTRHKILSAAVLTKVILAPALSLGFVLLVSERLSLEAQVLVMESAMGSMLTAGIVSEEVGFDSQLTQAVVATSILISLLLAPVWFSLVSI